MICNADFQDMLDKHIKSGADITLMYFDNSDDSTNCDYDGVYLKQMKTIKFLICAILKENIVQIRRAWMLIS